MNHRTLGLTVRNFRTLTDTKLLFGPLTVMVGPDTAGKSNVLHALEFLGDVTRKGIEPALQERGGFDALAFRGGRNPVSKISFGVEGVWSDFASEEAPDRYELSISRRRHPEPRHREHMLFRQEIAICSCGNVAATRARDSVDVFWHGRPSPFLGSSWMETERSGG
ncbi:AAA family ATPase [Streptomyces sp. TRM70350]|uniref:AAA family ATPase n=1 Tax=Streptomyces sp. TRM70350 TaxID=2856165 RepID=UPI00210F3EDF|nr:hypothetical protein [Streptomyces sp. TRM70350]